MISICLFNSKLKKARIYPHKSHCAIHTVHPFPISQFLHWLLIGETDACPLISSEGGGGCRKTLLSCSSVQTVKGNTLNNASNSLQNVCRVLMLLLRIHVLCNTLFSPAVSWNKIREDECRASVSSAKWSCSWQDVILLNHF